MAPELLDLLTNPDKGSVRRFLVQWHGEREPGNGLPAAQLERISLPEPLRDFYEFAGRWPVVMDENGPIRLLPPTELVSEEGKVIYCVENQGVYLWSTSPEGEDPPVWGRFDEAGEQWVEEEEPLSRCLLQSIIFQAVLLAPEGASVAWLESSELERVLRPLRALPLGNWRWPAYPTRFYAGECGVLAVSCPNRGPEGGGQVSLWIGAQDQAALAYLDEFVDRSWEYYSRRDRA
jgi:hypothetical protein